MKKYRVDIFNGLGQHDKIPFNTYIAAKHHAKGVKKDMGSKAKVYILESISDTKYDVLEMVE